MKRRRSRERSVDHRDRPVLVYAVPHSALAIPHSAQEGTSTAATVDVMSAYHQSTLTVVMHLPFDTLPFGKMDITFMTLGIPERRVTFMVHYPHIDFDHVLHGIVRMWLHLEMI